MAAVLEDVDVAHQVRADIGMRVFNRVSDARLGGQVNHFRHGLPGKRGSQCVQVGQVDPMEGEARVFLKQRQAVALELDAIVIVDAVDADHALAASQQISGHVKSDKAGSAGDEVRHFNLSSRANCPYAYRLQ